MMTHLRSFVLLTAPVLVLCISGCQTNPHDAEPYPQAASKILFAPTVRNVSIAAGEGQYPNLYTGASHAIWGGDVAPMAATEPTMAETKPEETMADASTMKKTEMGEKKEEDMESMAPMEPTLVEPQMRTQGLKIVCYLESEFPDRSIAYDAVALRGMSIYLKLPDGKEVVPTQQIVDSELSETPVGALSRYGRHLTLYFPRRDFMVENPAANPAAGGVRLMLEGHGTQFYFEWQPMPSFVVSTEPRLDYKVRNSARKYYHTTSSAVKRAAHNFD